MGLHWNRLRVTSALSFAPTRSLAAVPPLSRGVARRLFAGLAAAYLVLVALGLPVANTREALETGLLAASDPADGVVRLGNAYPPDANPDDDLSDAIPVSGLVVFAVPIPRLEAPRPAPGLLVGETDAPRRRVFRSRADFERGPPSLT